MLFFLSGILWLVVFARFGDCCLPGPSPPPPPPPPPPAPVASNQIASGGQQAAPANSGVPQIDPSVVSAGISALGGSAKFDGIIPAGGTNREIRATADLNCPDFEPSCHWRNEVGWPGKTIIDDLEFGRAVGAPDGTRQNLFFGTATPPNGKWAITGTGTKIDPNMAALLVSDPVLCIPGDGELSFRYWTSPRAKIRVCKRRPNDKRNFVYCSPAITGGDPGPARVVIPGPDRDPFEIVIEASGFDFSFAGNNGGAVILDEISYEGIVCSALLEGKTLTPSLGAPVTVRKVSAPENVQFRHLVYVPVQEFQADSTPETQNKLPLATDPPTKSTTIPPDTQACFSVSCTFEEKICYTSDASNDRAEFVLVKRGATGNPNTGIRSELEGGYAVVTGPAKQALLFTRPFVLRNRNMLNFCVYRASYNSTFIIYAIERNSGKRELYRSLPLSDDPYYWICDSKFLRPGDYDGLEFVAENLKNKHSYLAIDEIQLTEQGGPVC